MWELFNGRLAWHQVGTGTARPLSKQPFTGPLYFLVVRVGRRRESREVCSHGMHVRRLPGPLQGNDHTSTAPSLRVCYDESSNSCVRNVLAQFCVMADVKFVPPSLQYPERLCVPGSAARAYADLGRQCLNEVASR